MTTPARKIFDEQVLPLFQERESQAKWIERARKVAVEIAKSRGFVTADDVWHRCPPSSDFEPRVMGAVFHRDSGLVKTGQYINSIRKASHGRPIPKWTWPPKVQ
jgi:hypothetical protein